MGAPFPLDFAPGIVKVDAPYALRGRFIDCDKVRFVKGKAEKWKGWELFAAVDSGVPRAMKGWDDFSDARWLAIGTHTKLYLADFAGVITNITPIRESGTLGADPFAMVDTSNEVTVTDTAHGLSIGTSVYFSGATASGGITIDGEYSVDTIIDVDHYTILHSTPATSTDATGGGASVLYEYEINAGERNVIVGDGYGTGTFGTGTYGTPRASSNFLIYARMWSLETYGENLLALPSGNFLYQWDPDTPAAHAARVANSPFGNFMFMTNERYPVVLGVNGDNMALAWPDQNDITNWTPGSASTANERKLQKGSRLVAGANLAGISNLLWTDEAIYQMNYTGQRNFVYNTLVAGEQCGLIGPHAFVIVAGRAYWMSNFDFHMYGGSVSGIPNSQDIRDWLYEQLDSRQNWKAVARFSAIHNEVLWNFVPEGQTEPTLYVAVSLDDFSWTHGTLNRTAWTENGGIDPHTYATDADGNIFDHEIGVDAAGEAMAAFLESAPLDTDDGSRSMNIWGYIPNFQRQSGDIEITIKTWDMPQHTAVQELQAITIVEGQGIEDLHINGRQASVRLDCFQMGGDFRLGIPRVEISPAGKRRGAE